MVKNETLRATASNATLKAAADAEATRETPRRPFWDGGMTASPFATLSAGRPSIFAAPVSQSAGNASGATTAKSSTPAMTSEPVPPEYQPFHYRPIPENSAASCTPSNDTARTLVSENWTTVSHGSLDHRTCSNGAAIGSYARFPLNLDHTATTFSPSKPSFGVPAFTAETHTPNNPDVSSSANKQRVRTPISNTDVAAALQTISKTDDIYTDLLRQRLADSLIQLSAPDVPRSIRWYLEAECRRIEDKLEVFGQSNLEHLKREPYKPSYNPEELDPQNFTNEEIRLLDHVRRQDSVAIERDIRRETMDRIEDLFEIRRETMNKIECLFEVIRTKQEEREARPEDFTVPFCNFLTDCPTVFHAVSFFGKRFSEQGFIKLSERSLWTEQLKKGGKYYVERNGSSLIAFTIGKEYRLGNGIAMIAAHVDAITARLKPVSNKKTTAGYVQLGVAPYAGGLSTTWWDRDLSIGGKVLVKDATSGKITTRLVKLGWPIARIPTLAPHFGVGMMGQQNPETQAVPIIGLDNSDVETLTEDFKATTLGGVGKFASTQPPRLVRAIAGELNIQDVSTIVNWELELFDLQPATVGGVDKDLIFGGRIDDKLCSYAAVEGLISASSAEDSGIVNMVALFDDEEIGSLLRQGARGNFMPSVVERIVDAFSIDKNTGSASLLAQTYARSFLISADVTHAVNPNFLSSYLDGHAPRLNVGPAIQADGNGHTTTDAVSTAFLTRIAEKCGSKLQVFMVRNDSRSGGTVGPTLSSSMGVRAIDCGIPQLSMHSIRATTGSLDPGLGVKLYKGFFDHFEAVDEEFAD